MAEEKNETVREIIARFKPDITKPIRLTENNRIEVDAKLSKKYGNGLWCTKRWELSNVSRHQLAFLYKYPNEFVVDMLLNSENSLNPNEEERKDGNKKQHLEKAKRNPLYEPRIAKLIDEFSDQNYCSVYYHSEKDRQKRYDFVSVEKFSLNDEKILGLANFGPNIFAIGEKYVYILNFHCRLSLEYAPLHTIDDIEGLGALVINYGEDFLMEYNVMLSENF